MEYTYSLCAGIIVFGLLVTYTDTRYRLIQNIDLLFALAYALLIHLSFATIGLTHISWKLLTADFILAFLISYLLFIKHFWSAGDAKFFIVLCMLMPHKTNVPLFTFFALYLFVNINLVSFLSIIPWAIKKSWGHAKLITLSQVKSAAKKLLISLLVLFSISWIIWAACSKISGLNPLLKVLLFFLSYWAIATAFEKIKNQTWLYVFAFVLGIVLRIAIQPWIFSNLHTMLYYLLSTIKFTLIFSLAGSLMKNPSSAVMVPMESRVVNAPYMLIGALLAQTPFVFWIMDKIITFKRR